MVQKSGNQGLLAKLVQVRLLPSYRSNYIDGVLRLLL